METSINEGQELPGSKVASDPSGEICYGISGQDRPKEAKLPMLTKRSYLADRRKPTMPKLPETPAVHNPLMFPALSG